MAMQTVVNLPVKDLTKATEFFKAIGGSLVSHEHHSFPARD
jgi:predicted lactoylglutathione lyase